MLRKILAVDDSMLTHQMCRLFLARYKGSTLLSAMNGVEALEQLGREAGIDLILLDISMPMMNGIEFLRQVHEHPAWREIPVIIITTGDKEEQTLLAMRMGARGFLRKPFQAPELRDLIEKVTGERAEG